MDQNNNQPTPQSPPISNPVPDAMPTLTPPQTPEPPDTIQTPVPASNYPTPPLTIDNPVNTDSSDGQLPKLTEGTQPVPELQVPADADTPKPPPAVSGIDANPVLQDPLSSNLPDGSDPSASITQPDKTSPQESTSQPETVSNPSPPISLNNIDGVITTGSLPTTPPIETTNQDSVPTEPAITSDAPPATPELTVTHPQELDSSSPSDTGIPNLSPITPTITESPVDIPESPTETTPELSNNQENPSPSQDLSSISSSSTLSIPTPAPDLVPEVSTLETPLVADSSPVQNQVKESETEVKVEDATSAEPQTEPTPSSTTENSHVEPNQPEPINDTQEAPGNTTQSMEASKELTPDSQSPLAQKAEAFGIDANKPFFPINTMRLMYLQLINEYTSGNQQAKDQLQKAIGAINALVDKRNSVIQSEPTTNPIDQMHECIEEIKTLSDIIPTPTMRHEINNLFTENFPLQEKIMISLEARLKEDSLNEDDLFTLLKIRSMDSVLYATALGEIIRSHQPEGSSLNFDELAPQLHLAIDSTLQLNDLCDAVAYAKQDLESGSAPIIEVIKKVKSQDQRIKDLVRELSKKLNFTPTTDKKLTQLVIEYQAELLKTIGL